MELTLKKRWIYIYSAEWWCHLQKEEKHMTGEGCDFKREAMEGLLVTEHLSRDIKQGGSEHIKPPWDACIPYCSCSLVWVLATLFPNPASSSCCLGGSGGRPQYLGPWHPTGRLIWSSWLQPGLGLAITGIWEVNWKMGALLFIFK